MYIYIYINNIYVGTYVLGDQLYCSTINPCVYAGSSLLIIEFFVHVPTRRETNNC